MRALLVLLLATSCAHTPPQPPGEPCPTWEAGWIEYRPADCSWWRCDAATLCWQQVDVKEVCAW